MQSRPTIPPASEPADVQRAQASRRVWHWSLLGSGFGIVSASAYLLLGGEYIFGIPRWARIAFYPGFTAGFQAVDWR